MGECSKECCFQNNGECWFACKDKFYQQGRADCLKEAHRFADQESYKEGYKRGIEQGRADAIDECIEKLAKSDDTILSDRQYYTLLELKEQKNG